MFGYLALLFEFVSLWLQRQNFQQKLKEAKTSFDKGAYLQALEANKKEMKVITERIKLF